MGVPGASDTAYIGGTAAVQVPGGVTLQNLRLGSDATLVNDGALKVTGWTSSDGVVGGVGELKIPDGAAATINLSATKLARNSGRPMLGGAWCPDPAKKGKGKESIKFGKVKNGGKLKINVDSSVDVEFDDVTNDGGTTTLSVNGSSSDAPIKLQGLRNVRGTLALVGTGTAGRAFESNDEISNKDEMVFDGARTLAKKDFTNEKGATMSLKDDSFLGSSDKSKKLENVGTLEVMDGDAEIQMEWSNKGGHLHVGTGNLKISPPDGKTVTQSSGTTTIDDGTLEIVDSTKDAKNGGLQIKGGVLDGSGTIEGNVTIDGGAINVGHSPGLMIINGNFTQTANGLMNMQIWGPIPGLLYDQLQVSGIAYLDGTLNVEYGNNYAPGQSAFWHVRYVNYVGKYATVNFVNPTPGKYYRIMYSSIGVYSQVLSSPPPGALQAPASPSFTGVNYRPTTPRQYLQGA